jgi:hypothetical protein
VFTTTVAGVTHNNADGKSRQVIIRKHVKPGMPLVLKREPDNPHDSDAVAVWLVDPPVQIGYLKSGIADVATRMDDGEVHSARVVDLTGGTKEYPAVGVAIEVWQGEEAPRSTVATLASSKSASAATSEPNGILQRIGQIWRRGASGKALVGCGALMLTCGVCSVFSAIWANTPEGRASISATATAEVIAQIETANAPTATPVPPTVTRAPSTATPEPSATATLEPTAEPTLAPTRMPPTEGPSPTPAPTRDPRKPFFEWNWGVGTQDGNACICGGPDLNCADFANWEASQACFDKCGGNSNNNVFGLDNNKNGVVCENPK